MNDREVLLDQSYLIERLHYNAENGIFTWREAPRSRTKQWNATYAGRRAGSEWSRGYRCVYLLGRNWLEHRLVWLYVHGEWPQEDIDHINGDRSDNRISNLRACTRGENLQNTRIRKDNTSGYPGVSYRKDERKWVSRLKVRGKYVWQGRFGNPEEAYEAYLEAKRTHHTFNPIPRAEAGGAGC